MSSNSETETVLTAYIELLYKLITVCTRKEDSSVAFDMINMIDDLEFLWQDSSLSAEDTVINAAHRRIINQAQEGHLENAIAEILYIMIAFELYAHSNRPQDVQIKSIIAKVYGVVRTIQGA